MTSQAIARALPEPDTLDTEDTDNFIDTTCCRLHMRERANAPRAARRALRAFCRGSNLPAPVVDNAAFVVGELVLTSARQARGSSLVVTFESSDHNLVVRVADQVKNQSGLRIGSSTSAERSWSVVRRIASTWGVKSTPEGREFWASIRH
jgi:hypothetical protein